MTVSEAYDSFIISRRLSGLSPKTVSDYVQFVSPFVSYLGLENMHKIFFF